MAEDLSNSDLSNRERAWLVAMRLPGWLIWYGEYTGHFWAVPRILRLSAAPHIEALTADELEHRALVIEARLAKLAADAQTRDHSEIRDHSETSAHPDITDGMKIAAETGTAGPGASTSAGGVADTLGSAESANKASSADGILGGSDAYGNSSGFWPRERTARASRGPAARHRRGSR